MDTESFDTAHERLRGFGSTGGTTFVPLERDIRFSESTALYSSLDNSSSHSQASNNIPDSPRVPIQSMMISIPTSETTKPTSPSSSTTSPQNSNNNHSLKAKLSLPLDPPSKAPTDGHKNQNVKHPFLMMNHRLEFATPQSNELYDWFGK